MWIWCKIMQMLQLLPRLPFRQHEQLLIFIGIFNPLIFCRTGHQDTQGYQWRNQGYNLDFSYFICPCDALLACAPWWNTTACSAERGARGLSPPFHLPTRAIHFLVWNQRNSSKMISNTLRFFKGRLHLLVSPLDGAVSLIEVDDISELITCWGRKNKEKNRWEEPRIHPVSPTKTDKRGEIWGLGKKNKNSSQRSSVMFHFLFLSAIIGVLCLFSHLPGRPLGGHIPYGQEAEQPDGLSIANSRVALI